MVQLLLENNANVLAQDSHGDTPLHWACRTNRTLIAKMLLRADPNLHSACLLNYKKKAAVELCSKYDLLQLFSYLEEQNEQDMAQSTQKRTDIDTINKIDDCKVQILDRKVCVYV